MLCVKISNFSDLPPPLPLLTERVKNFSGMISNQNQYSRWFLSQSATGRIALPYRRRHFLWAAVLKKWERMKTWMEKNEDFQFFELIFNAVNLPTICLLAKIRSQISILISNYQVKYTNRPGVLVPCYWFDIEKLPFYILERT